jgi:hypothetical protein
MSEVDNCGVYLRKDAFQYASARWRRTLRQFDGTVNASDVLWQRRAKYLYNENRNSEPDGNHGIKLVSAFMLTPAGTA